jgi:hypothetical protein
MFYSLFLGALLTLLYILLLVFYMESWGVPFCLSFILESLFDRVIGDVQGSLTAMQVAHGKHQWRSSRKEFILWWKSSWRTRHRIAFQYVVLVMQIGVAACCWRLLILGTQCDAPVGVYFFLLIPLVYACIDYEGSFTSNTVMISERYDLRWCLLLPLCTISPIYRFS